MGTYTRTTITAQVNSKAQSAILTVMKKHRAEDCWLRYCESTKWGPDELMIELGKRFHQINCFRLYGCHSVNSIYQNREKGNKR